MSVKFVSILLAAVAIGRAFGRSHCSSAPTIIPGFNNSKLPDPFVFNNGAPVASIKDWACRRREIIGLLQAYENGVLPPKPPTVSGSFAGKSLTVNAGGVNNKSISFSSTITFPSGAVPDGGWPLLIGLDGGSIPVPPGIAVLNFNEGNIAQQNDQSSRGVGLFYNLYGANHSASSMTAWTWAISRIIDVLEETPSANINLAKLAVTGCSRNGKGALTAGAFEERIALTIAQESGSGGDTCWRLSKFEQDSGQVVQTATEIVQENVWFSPSFDQFVNTLEVLPYDHHFLMALVAPRGLLAYENTDFEWLSPVSSFGCNTVAHTVFEALGVQDHHGFVQVGGHAHCAFPSNLTGSLDAFFDKFINGNQSASTDFFTTNDVFSGVPWVPSNWTTWTTPSLS